LRITAIAAARRVGGSTGRPPSIRVSSTTLGDGRVRLTIEDAGPGVPDDTLDRIFEKFYRVPGSTGGSRSGTGIGLAVVQGLVEAMHGAVVARRGELGGLAIDIDLPAAALQEEALGAPPEPTDATQRSGATPPPGDTVVRP